MNFTRFTFLGLELRKNKGRMKMSINFYPFREQLAKEVEQCIALGKLDTLLSFCNSCVFKMFEKRIEPECQTCMIKHGIARAIQEKKAAYSDDKEVLGVCYGGF